jgi:hypothetical protein
MPKVTAFSNTKSTSNGRQRNGEREMGKEKEKLTKTIRKGTLSDTDYYASEYTSKQTYSSQVKAVYSYYIKHLQVNLPAYLQTHLQLPRSQKSN